MSVPLLDLPAILAPIRAEMDEAIARVLDHGRFVLGPEVAELEARVAEYCDTPHAVACASGTDAILLALMALGVGPGDRVVTTPYTFFATGSCIARLGAIPVFVDIDPLTYNISPDAVARYLESCSAAERASVKALMPVHLYGQCADMDPLLAIAARYGLPVVEDAAQAIGSEYKGRRAGSMGIAGCLSFFPSKNLGCIGDGGMLVTTDAALADRARILRVHGAAPKYHHHVIGINSRLDTIHAAVLLVGLRHLDAWTAARQANAARYRELLADTQVQLPTDAGYGRHIYNQFVVRTADRDALKRHLDAAGIGTEVYYPIPLHAQKCFEYLGYRPGDCPESMAAAAETLALPVYPALRPEQIEAVTASINANRPSAS